jgi:hypothetical protein
MKMPIYDPSAEEHPVRVQAPASPPSAKKDTCHRHLKASPDEWTDSSASWHNRPWADSDFAPTTVTPPSESSGNGNGNGNEPVQGSNPSCQRCGGGRGGLAESVVSVGVVEMGPCTCADGSLHMHMLEVYNRDEKEEQGEDSVREERIREARRELLFGDEKVSSEVALQETERLRISEERIEKEREMFVKHEEGQKIFDLDGGGEEKEKEEEEEEEEGAEEKEGEKERVARNGEVMERTEEGEKEEEEEWADEDDEEDEMEAEEEEELVEGGKVMWMDASRMC